MWTYITPIAVRSSIVALCILSGLLTIARTAIRARDFGRIYADDAFLLLAILTLVAGTGVFYAVIDGLVYEASINGHTTVSGPNFLHNYAAINLKINACVSLFWLSVFAVKFSFLFYFGRLIDQLPNLKLWWWVCMVVCIPFAVANVISPWIICYDYNGSGLQACANARAIKGQTVTLACEFAFDILTDILVISIPVIILRKTSLQLRQKILLGIMLCLSILLILTAIFRYVSTQASIAGGWALMWYLFLHDIQACIAIMLICVTAFRTLFPSTTSTSKDLTHCRSSRPWRRSRSPVDIENHYGRMEIQRRESIVIHEERLFPSIPPLERYSTIRTILWENGIATRGSVFEPWDKPPLGYAHTMRRPDTYSQEFITRQSSHHSRSEGAETETDPEKGRPSYETFVQQLQL